MSLTGLGPKRHVYDDLGDAEKSFTAYLYSSLEVQKAQHP